MQDLKACRRETIAKDVVKGEKGDISRILLKHKFG